MKAPKMTKVVIPTEKKIKNTDTFSSEKKRIIDPRPSFSIAEDVLPAIKDWKTKGRYNLEIEVEQTGSRIEDYGDNKGKLVGEFRICGIMVDKEEGGKSEEKGDKEDKSEFPEKMRVKK